MTPTELRIMTAFREMHVFCKLDPLHLHKLATIATERQFEEGEIIYRAGETGQAIYLIQEGEVAVEMEVEGYGPVRLFTVGPGQLFGWNIIPYPTETGQSAGGSAYSSHRHLCQPTTKFIPRRP